MNPGTYQMPKKPKSRSRLRIAAGKVVYRLMRYAQWYLFRIPYARQRSDRELPFVVFGHETPLFRKLRNVDMRLQYNKVQNLRIASGKLNGILLKPGETFSYWRLIGKPGKAGGYLPGLVLQNGKLTEGAGGGLCQLSNLIYWMTLHTPLTIKERYRHSYDVFPDAERTQPFGSGATCVYNYRDLQIYNGTDTTFQLQVRLTDTHLTGQWRSGYKQVFSYEVYERNHCFKPFFTGGYLRCNELYRRKHTTDGTVAGDEFITSNEALMLYPPFLSNKSTSL